MLPLPLVSRLSPNAAKLYLLLLALRDPADPSVVQVSRQRLASLLSLSQATCCRALRELRTQNLIRTGPHHYQKPATYLLVPLRLISSPISSFSTPRTAPTAPPQATLPPQTPAPRSNTPCASPVTRTLNTAPMRITPDADDDLAFLDQFTPEAVQNIRDSFTPEQKAHFLTIATQALERLQRQPARIRTTCSTPQTAPAPNANAP